MRGYFEMLVVGSVILFASRNPWRNRIVAFMGPG
jgi:hypothetical protein